MPGTVTRFRMRERSTGVIEGDIIDQDENPVAAADLTGATLTLFDLEVGAQGGSPRPGIINGRDEQDVLNANDVTIDADGHFEWTVQPEDNAPPDDADEAALLTRREIWRHRAMFVFTWASGEYREEFEIDVENLRMQHD